MALTTMLPNQISGEVHMAQGMRKSWRELCSDALQTKNPDELMKILQELNKALKQEEQVRRDFREAIREDKFSENRVA